jgi:hypothetical protein
MAIAAPIVQTGIARGATLPPAPTGGAIVSGTYHAVSATFFPEGDCAYIDEDSAEAFVITALTESTGTVEAAGKSASGDELHASLRYALQDSSASVQLTCPAPEAGAGSAAIAFSATASEIRLSVAKALPTGEPCGTLVTVLAKQ